MTLRTLKPSLLVVKRTILFAAAISGAVMLGLLTGAPAAAGQDDIQLSATKLKAVVEGLGYEVKALSTEEGKEKYEFKVTKGSLDVPMAVEISPSKNYIWLTVFLGPSKPNHPFEELLKKNGAIQPSFFYITSKGNLMMGIPMDNRSVNPASMKRNIDKIAADVSDTESLWSVK